VAGVFGAGTGRLHTEGGGHTKFTNTSSAA
jgi:hypothetical protein